MQIFCLQILCYFIRDFSIIGFCYPQEFYKPLPEDTMYDYAIIEWEKNGS